MRAEPSFDTDATSLMAEVRRYLAAVETFRAEGVEPRWEPEHELVAPAARVKRRGRTGLDRG
jgi:hypothetical protein